MESMNNLYEEHVRRGVGTFSHEHLNDKGLMLKSGKTTRPLSKKELNKLLAEKSSAIVNGVDLDYQAHVIAVVRFKTESDGLKQARKFKRLAENPLVKLEIKFEKITNEDINK